RGRFGRRADGRVQGVRPQASAVPDVADPPPLRARRLAGDDGDHPLLADLGDLRGHRPGPVHLRLHPPGPAMKRTRALVYGLAVTGEAVAAALVAHGHDIVVADDQTTAVRVAAAQRLGTELIGAPEVDEIAALVEGCDLVCPAPGVPETHDVIRAAEAAGVPVVTELDLAYEWEAERRGGPRPMLAVTGTDGKTTTTMLVA